MWSHATPEPPIAVSGAAVVAIAPLMDVLALPARLLIKKHREGAVNAKDRADTKPRPRQRIAERDWRKG